MKKLIGAGLATIEESGAGVGIGIVFGLVIGWIIFDLFIWLKNHKRRNLLRFIITLFIITIFLVIYVSYIGEVNCAGSDEDKRVIKIINHIENKYYFTSKEIVGGGLVGAGMMIAARLVVRAPMSPLSKLAMVGVVGLMAVGINEMGNRISCKEVKNEGIDTSLSDIEHMLNGLIKVEIGTYYLFIWLIVHYIIYYYMNEKEVYYNILGWIPSKYIKTKEFLKRRVENKKKIEKIWFIVVIILIFIGIISTLTCTLQMQMELLDLIKNYLEVKGLDK